MKKKPSMKKPQLDLEAEALKFASGETHEETPASKTTGSRKPRTGHDAPRKQKTRQGSNASTGIKVREAKNGYCTILAEGCMNIYLANRQKSLLMEALHQHDHVEIDLSEVEEMDTAGLQLLLLLKRTATQIGKSVSLVAHSPASLDVIDRYNLAGYFGDPVIIPSTSR